VAVRSLSENNLLKLIDFYKILLPTSLKRGLKERDRPSSKSILRKSKGSPKKNHRKGLTSGVLFFKILVSTHLNRVLISMG